MVMFNDIFIDDTKNGRKIPKEEYLKNGLYPIIDQGQEYIAGYSNDKSGIYENVPVVIFGDHTRIVKYFDKPFFLGADGVKVLKAKDRDVNHKYLYYALSNAKIPDTGYNRHFKWLKELDFNLVNKEKQDIVVEVLDKLESLIEQRRQQLQKLDELIKARFVEMFGDLEAGTCSCKVEILKNLAHKICDGVHAKPQYTDEGKPFLSVVNINKRKVDFTGCKYVSETDYQKMIKSTNPERGDVLYTKVGATYGIPAYIDTDKEFCLYVSVCLIKPIHEKINSRFLALQMDMPFIKHQADKRIKGIGVPDLHLNQIREFNIICPERNKQEEFVDFVQKIDKSKLSVQQSLEKLETLKKALMQKCFG